MSHFSTFVFTESKDSEFYATYEDLLEPFSENKPVKPYIYQKKEDALREVFAWMEENDDRVKELDEEGIHLTGMTETQLISWWTGIEMFDNDGNPLTTYNPDSKWDWYSLGGRWNGELTNKEGVKTNVCLASEVKEWQLPYAFVLPDFTWHEPGPMLYFGLSAAADDSQKKFEAEFELIKERAIEKGWTVHVVDCHI